MTYLLDTNVVSETRKRAPDPNVLLWFGHAAHNDLYISVLTLGELKKGVEKRRATDAEFAASLDHWLHGLETMFADRILPIDTNIAMTWGALVARETLPVIDSLIAATAMTHGLIVVSRNVEDIARTGAAVVDPWKRGPSM